MKTAKKIMVTGAFGAALATAALASAGSAQAANPDVWWDQLPYGLQAHVRVDAFAPAHCVYRADAVNNPFLADYVHEFDTPGGVSQHDWIITAYGFPMAAIPTGTKWHTTVDCFIKDQPTIHGDFFQHDGRY
jgi:hypothetical protein